MASKRHQRRKACDGKRRYDTVVEAQAGARKLKKFTGKKDWLVAYRCKFCHGFHFGHPPAKVRQAIAAKRYDTFTK